MEAHVEASLVLEHPFRAAPLIPVDLKYVMKISEDVATAGIWRAEQWATVENPSSDCEELDRRLWLRIDSTVHGIAGTLRLGLLSTFIRMLKWPD